VLILLLLLYYHYLKEKEGLLELSSSQIQAPFLVILTKPCFFTGETSVTNASLMFQDRLVCSMKDPKTDKTVMLLLAEYFCLCLEYPQPYMQFMRAIEHLVTGAIAPVW
jgi:hypothetical protein